VRGLVGALPIGKYGQLNFYKLYIVTEGFFGLLGQNEETGKALDSGRVYPLSPFEFDAWYTLILESRYRDDQVVLDATIRRRRDGEIVGRYHCVDTEVLLRGGATGMHILDPVGVNFQLDNFELELVHE